MSTACVDVECERRYLSCALRWPEDLERHPVSPIDFTTQRHVQLAQALRDLRAAQRPMDLQSLETELKSLGTLAQCGGWDYVFDLAVLDALSAGSDARRIRMLARARRLREAALRTVAACEAGELGEVREHLEQSLEMLAGGEAPQSMSAAEVVAETYDELSAPLEKRGRSIRFGMGLLDWAIGGVPPGTMTIVGGRTSSGKSSIMLAWALSMATNGHHAGVVSCEDAKGVLGPRLLAHLAGVDSAQTHRGEVELFDFPRLAEGCEAARKVRLDLTFPIGRDLETVRADVAHLVRDRGCDVIFVDYLQAVRVELRSHRHDKAVADVAKALKGDCAKLNVPLILGSQLSRPGRDKPFTEPFNSDLKESGDIENEADVILLLWNENDEENAPAIGKISKIKWSPKRPRFSLDRDDAGAVIGVSRVEITPPKRSKLYDRINGSTQEDA